MSCDINAVLNRHPQIENDALLPLKVFADSAVLL